MPPVSRETIYVCSSCDAQASKWTGRCLECGAWGTLKETANDVGAPLAGAQTLAGARHVGQGVYRAGARPGPTPLQSFASGATSSSATIPTHCPPLDLVLGGGLVPGSVTLLAGEPGIGKSTILAQAAIAMAACPTTNGTGRVVYVTGEESPSQVRRRLMRLIDSIPDTLLFLDETDAGAVAAAIAEISGSRRQTPDALGFVIVDSIQSLRMSDVDGGAGSVSQVKACAAMITEAAKRSGIPVILAGQVTKDGDIAGPRVLEHLVDTVLFLEGDTDHRYRILRALKHRFGSVDEIALLTMTERGLEQVEDPSSELLRDRATYASGSAVTCLIEGRRPLLIEIQALVSPAGYGTPIRRATGVDSTRLGMLLAVLAKHANIFALDKDVYANAAGGIDARDPSADLALATAVASAVTDMPLDPKIGLFGEIGLAGELRPVALPELRLKEFARMGFEKVIIPKSGASRSTLHAPRFAIQEVGTVREALAMSAL